MERLWSLRDEIADCVMCLTETLLNKFILGENKKLLREIIRKRKLSL